METNTIAWRIILCHGEKLQRLTPLSFSWKHFLCSSLLRCGLGHQTILKASSSLALIAYRQVHAVIKTNNVLDSFYLYFSTNGAVVYMAKFEGQDPREVDLYVEEIITLVQLRDDYTSLTSVVDKGIQKCVYKMDVLAK